MLEHRYWANYAWDTRPFGGMFSFGEAAVTSQRNNWLDLFGVNAAD